MEHWTDGHEYPEPAMFSPWKLLAIAALLAPAALYGLYIWRWFVSLFQ